MPTGLNKGQNPIVVVFVSLHSKIALTLKTLWSKQMKQKKGKKRRHYHSHFAKGVLGYKEITWSRSCFYISSIRKSNIETWGWKGPPGPSSTVP